MKFYIEECNIIMMFSRLIKLLPSRPVYAHCDIPCGIYDPYPSQIAAHTVLRMTQMLKDLEKDDKDKQSLPSSEGKEEEGDWIKMKHDVSRMTHVKEEHGENLEHELDTLLNDYFKPEHFEKFPELKDLIMATIKLSSKVRQTIDLEVCQQLLGNTQKIAEIFWKTKGFEPVRVPSGYPTEGEIVTHK